MLNIGERIKDIRKKKNLTQSDLAKKLSKSVRMIQKYESNEVSPSWEVLSELSKVLESPMSYFIELKEERIKEELAFIEYLESIGYRYENSMDPVDWDEDPSGVKFPIAFDESPTAPCCIIVKTKDNSTSEFTNQQFEDFKKTIERSVEFEIFKAAQKK